MKKGIANQLTLRRLILSVAFTVSVSGLSLCQTSLSNVPPKPAQTATVVRKFVGEYLSQPDTVYIAEKDGHLFLVSKKLQYFELRKTAQGAYAFVGERFFGEDVVTFLKVNKDLHPVMQIGSHRFERLDPGTEGGTSFRIKSLKPVGELRKIALASAPPVETGDFLKPDFVELSSLDGTIKYDIRYATKNNFVGERFYTTARAFLQRPAADALLRAHGWLIQHGFGLLIHDAYRPWYVTKMFWDATPEDKKVFVADPSKGSRHNRGCAVDLTLYDLKTGKAVEMTGGYDEMSERSYPSYPGGTSLQRWHRDLLRTAMERQGFIVYPWEWWHFDYKDWQKYPIGTKTFEELER